MFRFRSSCVVVLWSFFSILPTVASAAEPPSVEGTLSLSGKELKLQHVVAWATTAGGDPATAVLASHRPINAEAILAALREKQESPEDVLRQPFVRVTFDQKGAPKSFYATGSGFTTNGTGGKLVGELKVADDRAAGQIKLPLEGKETLARGFDFRFDVPLLGSGAAPAPAKVAAAKLGVSGTFKGNGKAAKIAFVSVRRGEPFSDKPSLDLIFTEKDHTKDPRAKFKASFGDFGSSIVISCHENGDIFSCQVGHLAHKRSGFSSSGTVSFDDFQIVDGQVQGKLTTDGEKETFDETWEVDLTFAVALPADVKIAQPGAPAPKGAPSEAAPPKTKKPIAGGPTPSKPTPPAPPTERLKARELPILAGVEGVEFKKLVENISFKADANYKTLAAEIVKKLDDAGWQKDGSDLIGVSAILKRKKGAASLTIFVKPNGDGSQVTVMTKGLDWE